MSHKVTDEEKLRTIRILYMQVYNDERSLIPLAVELFHTLGSILEGERPENFILHQIDRAKFLSELNYSEK
jgi:hypothetical protein